MRNNESQVIHNVQILDLLRTHDVPEYCRRKQLGDAFHCGSTVITPRLLLSAAHCGQDLNATVIGFGHRWSRRTCMTDAIGPHPYKSCSFPYWASQIDMFTGKKLKKVQYNKCNHFPNPSNLNPICRKFNLFYQNEINEDYSTVDVVMSNNSWVRCYTENDLGNGWCGICNSFECQLGRDIPDGDEDWSWCARDCSGSDVIHSHSGTLDLQTVDIDLLTDEECSEFTQNFTTVNTTIELCAGYKHYISMPTKYSYIVLPNGTDHFLKISDTIKTNEWILGGKDACQGDSGGPLFITLGTSEDTKRAFLIGIVSRGSGCGSHGNPGIYTRVNAFLPWIRERMLILNNATEQEFLTPPLKPSL
ncbi:TMPRSS13 [Lepeophtheirus salmonis]|uniref:TMPRSS13 n=1 Tax=Lepeophtheirus salmonis TaxID=72036 RepID=A0A7R8H4X7_LEPSM|nr:TMPRSS13 [Lepeophtheirus salmonis]CAF2867190.1 TMPRSS13 [Lepeophtheirus salmonis]